MPGIFFIFPDKHIKTLMKTEIEDRLIKFSVTAYKLTGKLHKTDFTAILSNQLIRSATSAALNYGEAQGSETTRDFIHKIGVVIKELRESRVNFKIIKESDICKDNAELERILQETDELLAIFYATLKTAKTKLNVKQ
jgi:four helix bundle protein